MSEIIPPGVQSLMQAAVTTYNLPSTGSLYTKQETTGPRGQTVSAGALVATVDCRKGTTPVQQQGGFGGGFVTVRVPSFSLPAGTAATTEQLWVQDGTTYEITEVRTRGQREVAVLILVRALES